MPFKKGLVKRKNQATDFISGYFSPVKPEILQLNGQWDKYLPIKEVQNKNGFETYFCTSFSATNCLEALLKRITGAEYNFSDRALGVMAGTTQRGNSLWNIATTIRHNGLVREDLWPFSGNTWKEYAAALPSSIYEEAAKFLNDWITYYEWVNKEEYEVIKALEYAPLQVTVKYASGEGILKPSGDYDHAVTCYGYELGQYWKIYDHYNQELKRYAWTYKFGEIIKYSLVKKSMSLTLPNNTLVQLVEGNGGFGLFLDDSILIDDTAKIIATWLMRNNAQIVGKVKTLTQKDWDSVPHYNLKRERI